MFFSELCEAFPRLGELGFRVPEQVDGRFRLRSYGPHQIIHQKDSQLETIGILLEGSFRVFNELENGNLFMIEINDPISFTCGAITLAENHAHVDFVDDKGTVTPAYDGPYADGTVGESNTLR